MENANINITPKPAEYINSISLEDLQSRLKSAGINFAEHIEQLPAYMKPKTEEVHYGIEQLKDVVLLGIYIIKAFVLTNTNVLARWLAVVTALPNAIIGISDVPLEIADLNEQEVNELVDYIKSLVPEITNEDALHLIEHSIKVAWGIYNIVNLIGNLRVRQGGENDKEN